MWQLINFSRKRHILPKDNRDSVTSDFYASDSSKKTKSPYLMLQVRESLKLDMADWIDDKQC